MSTQYKYLGADSIRRLGGYEFAPKAFVEGYLSGRHRSRARGPSTEFHDYRQYVPGDDTALIDWRVFARTERHYLRTFEQETNLECHLFLDSSASMGFGAPHSKLDFGSFFAAALAYLVIRKGDRASLQIFDDKIRLFFPLGSTRTHLHTMLTALENNRPGHETSLAAALSRSFPLIRRKGTLVILSDFFDDPAAIFTALSPYLHRGFRIHLFHVLDPGEIDLSDRGLATFDDLESHARLVVHTDSLRPAYREAMREHIASLRKLAMARHIDYALARTDGNIFDLFDHITRL